MQQKNPKKRWFRRRPFIITIIVLALLLAYPLYSVTHWLFAGLTRKPISTVGQVSFAAPLPIPPLADATIQSDGTRVFNLTLQKGTSNFFDGVATDTWGINGNYLGPTLRAKRGEKVAVNVRNTLPEATSLHWHGMHLPAKMDGGPHQPIAIGGTWSPNWTIAQSAATLWYHPHPHGETENHVYRGLAGMFIIDDDNPHAAALPRTYGKDDIPVIVQDKKFTSQKQLDESNNLFSSIGRVGGEILVNGALTPHFNVTSQHVRLRLLNASTARTYNFGLSNQADIQIIASDGGLLEQPFTTKSIMLSPGERSEIIVAMAPGEKIVLRALPFESGSESISNRLNGSGDTFDVIELRAANTLQASPKLPGKLTVLEKFDETAVSRTRTFQLNSEQTINGKSMDMNRVDFSITKGATEIWEVTNTHDTPHNFHVHDVQFRVLSFDGFTPPPELQGRKDTIRVPPGKKVRLIMQFSDYSDPEYPYMFHCHLLLHEDNGMMGQFLVLEPGQEARAPAHRHD